jgi:hypothetical protein
MPALIMLVRTAGSVLVSTAANAGGVNYTREDAVWERGRNAMGPVTPVGRKHW